MKSCKIKTLWKQADVICKREQKYDALCQMSHVPERDGTFNAVAVRYALGFQKRQEITGVPRLGISLWKLWITICRKALLKSLCELVEQPRENKRRVGKSREKQGRLRVFPIFDEARRAAVWAADAVCGARPPPAGCPECKSVPANTNGIIHRNARSKIRRERDGKNDGFRLDAGKKVC